MKLEKRVATVTGAARGIGFACAKRFAQDGAHVMLSDIDPKELLTAVKSLSEAGFTVAGHVADVGKRQDVEALVAATVEKFGGIDIMLNNAGIAVRQDILAITEEDFDRVIGINLKGAFFGLQIAATQMIAQGRGGVVINMSSINSRLANPLFSTYAISKAGINQVTSTGALAFAPHGIRVVGIGPGTIKTDMLNMGFLTNDAQYRMIMSRTPAGRFGEASEVASVAAFLASDDASYMTGQTVYPDGGRLILNYVMSAQDEA